jgi:hypothetical protein
LTLEEVIQALREENAASVKKHGLWTGNYCDRDQADAIRDEFAEWFGAYCTSDTDGEHGEIAELLDLANVCIRRIMYLTGDINA